MVKEFWQIELDEDSKPKSAFTTRYGQYQFTRLPFGLATAPAAFQSLMDQVLAGLNHEKLMVYIDDILVFSETFEEHIETLNETFKRLHAAGLKTNPAKCDWSRTALAFCGHIVNQEGISTDPEKIKAVIDMPLPSCVKEVETFIGKAVYYSTFIEDFANVAKPLFLLKQKSVKETDFP